MPFRISGRYGAAPVGSAGRAEMNEEIRKDRCVGVRVPFSAWRTARVLVLVVPSTSVVTIALV
jgi:hypothetical protein